MWRDYQNPQLYENTAPVYKHREKLDGWSRCLKTLLVAFNSVFFLLSLGVTGGALYILIDKTFVSDVLGEPLLTVAAWLVVIGGGITIFVTFTGCCGATKQNRVLLIIYTTITGLALLMLAGGGVLALITRGQIGEEIIATMEQTILDDYGVNLDNSYNKLLTEAWDKGQSYMYCCSVRDQSWGTYSSSQWYYSQPGIETVDKPYVPISCCKTDLYGNYLDTTLCQTFSLGPPGLQSGYTNTALYYTGCYTAGVEWVYYYGAWLAGLGIGLGALMIFGACSSTWLIIKLDRHRKRNEMY